MKSQVEKALQNKEGKERIVYVKSGVNVITAKLLKSLTPFAKRY